MNLSLYAIPLELDRTLINSFINLWDFSDEQIFRWKDDRKTSKNKLVGQCD